MKITASKVRALVRSVLILVTAFGLQLSPEQVGAIQLVAEAILQLTSKSEDTVESVES